MWLFFAVFLLTACNAYQTADVTLPSGQVIKAKIADTPEKITKGLMFVKQMPENEGMLFVFDEEDEHLFWMKNTLIDLDIVFILSDGTVSVVHDRVPHTYTYTPDYQVPTAYGIGQYVLELNGGVSGKHGVEPGRKIKFKLNR